MNKQGERPIQRGVGQVSLRYRILIGIVLTNVGIVGVLVVFVTLDARNREKVASSLRENLFTASRTRMSRVVGDVVNSRIDEDLLVSTLLDWPIWEDVDDAVILSTEVDHDFFVSPLGGKHRPLPLDEERVRNSIEQAHELKREYEDGEWIAIPLTYRSALDGSVIKWGGVYFKPSEMRFDNPPLLASVLTIVVISGFGTALLIFVTYVLISRLVLRPVGILQSASERIAHGDFDVKIPTEQLGPEMARLVLSFNTMAKDVKDFHLHLEERIEEATEKVKKTQEGLVIAQRLAATGKLAAGIAHEINNPLAGMMNMTRSLLHREQPPEKKKQYLEFILIGLTRIQEIVRRVLTFSPREIRAQTVDVYPVLEQTVALVQHRLTREGIELVLAQKAQNLEPVFGDPGELQQAVLNLLINGVDALKGGVDAPKGGVDALKGKEQGGKIELSLSQDERGTHVAIQDNGCGMSETQLERVFDLFYTTKEGGEGTGLGLSIVYHIVVENHGGSIDIDSKVGKGTRITLTFPLAPAQTGSGSDLPANPKIS